MNNEDIVRYCTTSPENVNPAVLRSMLGSVEGGGSDEPFIVHIEPNFKQEQDIMDKTAGEIYQVLSSGKHIVTIYDYSEKPSNGNDEDGFIGSRDVEIGMILGIYFRTNDGQLSGSIEINTNNHPFSASTMDDYPYFTWLLN